MVTANAHSYLGVAIGDAVLFVGVVILLVWIGRHRRAARQRVAEKEKNDRLLRASNTYLRTVAPLGTALVGLVGAVAYLPIAQSSGAPNNWALEAIFGLLFVAGIVLFFMNRAIWKQRDK